MIWKQVNPAMWKADYMGYTVYKMLLYHDDKRNKDLFEYCASRAGYKSIKSCSWEYLKKKLQPKQMTLFDA